MTIDKATVSTSGTSPSSDQSNFYGLDAGVLAKAGSITVNSDIVTTTGDGANGVFACGSGTAITLDGTRISSSGKYAHAVMASGGGTITATNVTASTTGSNGATIATDRGGGTIMVSGGKYWTSGSDSPGIYSTGTIQVAGQQSRPSVPRRQCSVRSWVETRSLRAGRKTFRLLVEGCTFSSGRRYPNLLCFLQL